MATHLFILYAGSKQMSAGEVNKQIIDRVEKYATVSYAGGGHAIQSSDQEDHIVFQRDKVAKTFKKWITTNKQKFGIKRVDLLTDEQYSKLQEA